VLPLFRFELLHTCGTARRGRIHTPHGVIDTPAFMPVGTRAAVKGVAPAQLAETGAQIVLANTYHLMLRPTAEVVAGLGGLHRMMNWPGAILTDSGGFQVFSLAALRKIDDDGVTFQSHIDGAIIRLGPDEAMRIQRLLGADIIMAFDECPPLPADGAALRAAVERTIAWARRCKAAHGAPAVALASARDSPAKQALYGIVQGGLDVALRAECLARLVEIDFDGYALGGLSVGEPPEHMHALLCEFAHRMPSDRPRYLMGVGTPLDLVNAVAAGIDQFDCVLPTRNGRKGYAFTSAGVLRLRNSAHRLSCAPLDSDCDCHACRGFSRGYIRHLLMSEEVLGATLVSLHNLRFYQRLMADMRAAIVAGSFPDWRKAFLACPAVGGAE
jgi:queuine tRNA-ribosyltransferase